MDRENKSVTEIIAEDDRREAQRTYNDWWSNRVMRDEGDLFEVREPTTAEAFRALAILSILSWIVVGLMGAGVYWLFHR